MKKLLLLAAFGLLASPALAQSGGGHTATIDQVGGSNDGEIDQSGVDHSAMIDQVGTNTSDIIQRGSRPGEGNEARTIQVNEVGDAANVAVIDQNGDDLNAAGSEAAALLDPVLGGLGIDDGYYTPIAPGIVQVGQGNEGSIVQTGSWNSAVQVVAGDYNTADITQSGASNIAAAGVLGAGNTVDIDQSNSDPGDINNLAVVGVVGQDNYMEVDQTGQRNDLLFGEVGFVGAGSEMYNSTVNVTQSGDDNQVVGFALGDDNDIDVTQSGNGNFVGSVDYSLTLGGPPSIDDIASGISVIGDGNTVDITQSGDGNTATANILGNGNTSTITQN
jgi:hypothetical protein